jgi:CHAT domain-containing protein/Tfp pilus assembly protein PilF
VTDDLKKRMDEASNRGWAALEQSDWSGAEQSYKEAIEHARQAGDRIAEALFTSYLGEAKRGQGEPGEARLHLEDCLKIAQEEDCLQIIAHAYFLLSEVESDAANDQAAIGLLWQALDASLECGDDTTAEVSFGKLGLIYLHLGWLEPASECFRQAMEQRPDGPNLASWMGNLGQTLAEMGQMEESITYYRRALDEAKQSGDLKAQAKCRASEGLSHFQQGEYSQAVDCFKDALSLGQQENDLESRGTWLGNLGNVYLRLGQTDKARELVEEGLELAKQLNDKHSEAAHLDSLGDCFLEQGQFEQALSHYRNALKIGQSISDKLGERIYLANIGRAYKRLGKAEPALEHLRKAIELFDQQRSRINSDTLKTSFAASGQDLYRDMIQYCLDEGKRVEALEYVGRAKSRAILDLLRNSPIDIAELQNIDDKTIAKLVARERELSSQIARLERIYWQGPPDSEGHRGAGVISAEDAPRLYSEWREVVDQLRRRHRNYANMVAVDTLSFKEIKALWQDGKNERPLPQNSAILEFFLTEHFLFAAAIHAHSEQPQIHILADPEELENARNDIADYLEMSATEGWEVPVSLCKRLYKRLIGPLVDALPDSITRLLLIPHGVLHRVPFAALHNGSSYLIEKFGLSYLPTTSLVPILAGRHKQITKSSKTDPLKYLVSAISDYSATRHDGIVFSARLRSAAGLEDLSYTLEEANTIFNLGTQHTSSAKLLTNQEVKDGLLTMFSDYPVVHFAGHAVFNPEEPLASGLVLADGSILTAARILQDNALRTTCGRLLVLSACQTGVSVITNGGEILGLARALMYAGMDNLILSLWEVADRSTAELMQNFHKFWEGGNSPIADALAQAQRTAIAQGQPIHAWAPFIHLGID